MSRLLNSEKHAIAALLEKNGFSIDQFELTERRGAFTLTHKQTRLLLEVKFDGVLSVAFSVYRKDSIEQYFHKGKNEDHIMEICVNAIPRWLKEVTLAMKEDELGDPFVITDKEKGESSLSSDDTFSTNEIKQIESKLDQFPTIVKTLPIESDKMEILIQEVKELRKELNPTKPKRKFIRELRGFLYEAFKYIVKDKDAQKTIVEFFRNIFQNLLN